MHAAQTFRIEGMHCASCAAIIERAFRKRDGVQSAVVNYATETATVSFDEGKVQPQDLSKVIAGMGYALVFDETKEGGSSARQVKQNKLQELAEMRVKVIS